MNVIVLEGINGTGKSTLANDLKSILTQNGYKCKIFHDGEIFEDLIKEKKHNAKTNLFLYIAGRLELVSKIKKEDLDFAIIDRYIFSTIVYQSIETGMNIDHVIMYAKDSMDGLVPDFIYYLEADLEQVEKNLRKRDSFKEGDEKSLRYLNVLYELIMMKYLERKFNILKVYEPQRSYLDQIVRDLKINGFKIETDLPGQ